MCRVGSENVNETGLTEATRDAHRALGHKLGADAVDNHALVTSTPTSFSDSS